MIRLMRSGDSWSGREANCAFLNTGTGWFADVSEVSGVGFLDDARGAAIVDWDADGDLDMWLKNRTGPQTRFMRNDDEGPNQHLAVQLVGRGANRDAIGARLELQVNDKKLVREIYAGGGFNVGSSKWVNFGLGESPKIGALTVRWPDKSVNTYSGLTGNGRFEIVQGEPDPRPVESLAAHGAALAAEPIGPPPRSEVARLSLAFRASMPELSFEDFRGTPQRSSVPSGRPVLVNLWASWCANCVKELKDCAAKSAELESAGVRVLAISVDKPEDRSKAEAFAQSLPAGFAAGMAPPEWVDTMRSVLSALTDKDQNLSIPTSFLFDRAGRLAKIYVGPLTPDELLGDVAMLDAADREILERCSPFKGLWLWDNYEQPVAVRYTTLAEEAINGDVLGSAKFFLQMAEAQVERYNAPASTRERAANAADILANNFTRDKPAEAAELWRMAAKLNSANPEYWLNLASALARAGAPEQLAEARESLQRGLQASPAPQTASDWALRGERHVLVGQWQEATDAFERALTLEPTRAIAINGRNRCLIELGRLDDAVSRIAEARTAIGPNSFVELRLADELQRRGKLPEAIAAYRNALQVKPDLWEARRGLATSLHKARDLDAAIDEYQKCLEHKADDGPILNNLGAILKLKGRTAEAIDVFRKAIQARPDDASAPARLAWILATTPDDALRNGGEALAIAERLCNGRGSADPYRMDVLAAAYAETAQFEKAVSTAQTALKLATEQNRKDLIAMLDTRVKLYQTGKPFRDAQ